MLCEDHAAVEGVQKEGVVYRGAYDALGEEFDLARSLNEARATVRLKQRGKRQKGDDYEVVLTACPEPADGCPPKYSFSSGRLISACDTMRSRLRPRKSSRQRQPCSS